MWICKKCGKPIRCYINNGELDFDSDGNIITTSIVVDDYEIYCHSCGKFFHEQVDSIGYWEDEKETLTEKIKILISGNNPVYFYFNKSDKAVKVWTESNTTGLIILGYCNLSQLPDGCICRGLD